MLSFNLSSHAQKDESKDIIHLKINAKTAIKDSLFLVLTRFSHKNPISKKRQIRGTAHLTLMQGNDPYELIISLYDSVDLITNEKIYASINWNKYAIQLKNFSFGQSIDVEIAKNQDLVKKTMPLNKTQLIDQANKIIASKYPMFVFDPDQYDVTAWRNSEKTVVNYRRIISFKPLDKKDENLRYDFEVNLTNQKVSPFDLWGFDKFYFPTVEEQVKINFVIKAFGLPRPGFNNSIVEDLDMYTIYLENDVAFGQYFIDKVTGKERMGSIEGSYEKMPEDPELIDKDPLIEIKE